MLVLILQLNLYIFGLKNWSSNSYLKFIAAMIWILRETHVRKPNYQHIKQTSYPVAKRLILTSDQLKLIMVFTYQGN